MSKEQRTMLIGLIIFVAMFIVGALILDLTNLANLGFTLGGIGAMGTLLTFISFISEY